MSVARRNSEGKTDGDTTNFHFHNFMHGTEGEENSNQYIIQYKGTLASNPRCCRRQQINEADICTPVAVDQRAANCLEEAIRSSPPCKLGVDHLTLASPSVDHC
ncbi:hypothetical protein TNCV_2335131 [Trichonephila clavipes]|uniref:Uncharacterized protein n=1 Tax=Trichonephila clavipes TaxID=2585209 RepID=A0A8X6VHT7_TRICX|nr:hypothetical protein TNCV_2335131 [Trichonephila clavipes]